MELIVIWDFSLMQLLGVLNWKTLNGYQDKILTFVLNMVAITVAQEPAQVHNLLGVLVDF